MDFFNIAKYIYVKKQNAYQILSLLKREMHIKENERWLLDLFIESIENEGGNSTSQLFQDLFVNFLLGDHFNKTFLEFGATDGLDLSNTYYLEKFKKWTGTLCEPSPFWKESLLKNRPNTNILFDCVWKESGQEMDFFMSEKSELSTLSDFKNSDALGNSANTRSRNKAGQTVKVKTISLNDIIRDNFSGNRPSYISIDTEGSEYEILSTFDFTSYAPIIFTVEHNFTPRQYDIDRLMEENNYQRVFHELTDFDAWYVDKTYLTHFRKFSGL